jgi:1,2-diacylglycerol 3-alpha-glucosyltransferase
MRIGLFSDAYLPEISGVTTTVSWLKEELERLGHEVYLYVPGYKGHQETDEHIIRFPAGRFAFHKASRVALPYRLEASRSFGRLDILHSHTPFSMGLAAIGASTRHHIPHVHTYHTHLMEDRRYLPRPLRPPERETERLIAAFCNRCTTVTAPSTPIKDELIRYGVSRPIYVFPFGVKLSLFAQEPVWSPRAALQIPVDAHLYLYVGRLAMEKNIAFLLRAFALIRKEDPRAVLVLAGDGPKRADLEALSEELGLHETVRFAGFLAHPQLVDLYKAADLFLFSSKTETQGLVLVEAMAGGVPAVAIGALGVLDVVQDGVNGLLAPEDEARFAQAVLDLMAEPETYERLKRGARETAEALSTHHSTLRLLQVFEECLEGRTDS